MQELTLTCQDDQRRHEVRRQHANGLDYLEVSDDQRRLTVYFLGHAPEGLTERNVQITGGRRIRDIRVTKVTIYEQKDPEIDNCMVVTVDKPGDFSTYRLCLVHLPDDLVFDPRYRCLDFSFKAGCPSDLDCKTPPVCPPKELDEPEISYLAKDYASFRQLILDRMALLMPEWTERHVPAIGITLVELLAYTGDYLSYYQDAVATEAYVQTARRRISIRRHARLVDYRMHEGCNARAWVHVDASGDTSIQPNDIAFITGLNDAIPGSSRLLKKVDLENIPASRYELFEPLLERPDEPLSFYVAHNTIRFYTWGDEDCCLPRGTTSVTLIDGSARPPTDEPAPDDDRPYPETPPDADQPEPAFERVLHLQPGDVLIFEEVIGPNTGNPADADPTHRHVVRLTHVEETVDPLFGQPLLEIRWAEEDALPFPLCISTLGPAPACEWLEDVSVARGNVLLVDHGRSFDPEALGCVPIAETRATCDGVRNPSDPILTPGRFTPTLSRTPLTYSQPLPVGAPASRMTTQDPRLALPWISLLSKPDCDPLFLENKEGQDEKASLATQWAARRDLLESDADDYHFVVEIDNERRAHLRFGDGELGRLPDADTAFKAPYRVGNGPAGNVGAEAISHVVLDFTLSGVTLAPRNPLPARGGIAPEPIEQVKLFAPHTFRRELQRAITADDYAAIVMREFEAKLQRAAAVLRWNGSWFEVLVAIDPRDGVTADAALLKEIEGCLYRYRRIGHDVVVRVAEYVPLDIALRICVADDFLRGHVRAALQACFSNRLLPDGQRGFFHPDNLSFGEAIYLSKIVAKAQAVIGVESVVVTRFQRLFEAPNSEIENGLLPLGPLEIARLDQDPNFPENGIIQFDLRGGR